MRLNRKGGVSDLPIFIILAFIFAVVAGLVLYMANTVEAELKENKAVFQKILGDTQDAEEMIDETFGAVPDAFQAFKWITVMIIIGMMMSIIIGSYIVNTRPVFLVAHILVTTLMVVIAVPLRNTYEVISTDPTFASTFAGFWGQTFIFLNLHIWVAVIGILGAILMSINIVRALRRDVF